MGDMTWMANLAAGLTVLITYTLLVIRYRDLERDVKELRQWRDAVDPPQNRHRRRDSDVLRMRDQGA